MGAWHKGGGAEVPNAAAAELDGLLALLCPLSQSDELITASSSGFQLHDHAVLLGLRGRSFPGGVRHEKQAVLKNPGVVAEMKLPLFDILPAWPARVVLSRMNHVGACLLSAGQLI